MISRESMQSSTRFRPMPKTLPFMAAEVVTNDLDLF